MLIDAFINAIFLYDDKMVITFNYKEGTKTITFAELQEAISNKNGSDLDCLAYQLRLLKEMQPPESLASQGFQRFLESFFHTCRKRGYATPFWLARAI